MGDGRSKGKSRGSRSAKGSYKGNTSKTGLSGLEKPKSETSSETQESAQVCHSDNSHSTIFGLMMAGVVMN